MQRAPRLYGLLVLGSLLVLPGPLFVRAQAPTDAAGPGGPAWVEHAPLLPREAGLDDYFGYAVAVDGPLVVVGAPRAGRAPVYAGAAAVFERAAGVFGEATWLRASDPAEAASFGVSVAVSGDVIVVGAPGAPVGDRRNAGCAYVFAREGAGFVERAVLRASDAAAEGQFGWSVAVSGETVVVGTRLEYRADALTPSAAYVFEPSADGYVERARLVAPGAPEQDRFGLSVAVEGDIIAVGAPLGAGGAGLVHVFARRGETYAHEAALRSSSGEAAERFGAAVALSGASLLVGAVGNAARGERAGAAYVFARSDAGWREEAVLRGADTDAGDYFGSAVGLSGDTAVVAALRDGERGPGGGSAHVFVRSGTSWHERGRSAPLREPVVEAPLRAVAVSGDLVLLGARLGTAGQPAARAVWVMGPGPAPELPREDLEDREHQAATGPRLAGQLGPSPRSGCGCRVGGEPAPAPLALVLLVALGLRRRTRR